MFAPPERAPLMSAMVVSTGEVIPSSGMYRAPTKSSVLAKGQRDLSSSISIERISTPTVEAIETPRFNSSHRSMSEATLIDPGFLKPVACPVSSSSASKSSDE